MIVLASLRAAARRTVQPMKYFAILKDSLREALDSKVLYVLLDCRCS